MIVDRHSAHRSKTVRAWLADHKDEIELRFLPSHSPEPNPDELVNSDLKRSLPHTQRARTQSELAVETRRFFHCRQRQPHVITGYFKAPHVRYILDERTQCASDQYDQPDGSRCQAHLTSQRGAS
ncbi:hypothetical protein QF035_010499 [Streptomyces umbrinus]|uniref:Tc1-like transposase DDE domain-containing protein n=1 Tax=Streptomyces umbrinus TaxID=67370 RepID=A0ABU0TBG2_9ACTN|nr:hypothetical protein [Streptomyces umbrinus]